MRLLILLFLLLFTQCKTQQIITLFVHGIADSSKQALPFEQTINNVHSFDFKCSKSSLIWPFNMLCYCSLGQADELTQLNDALQTLKEQFPKADGFILAGVSRGASAILNYLALYKPDNIKAIILESPFDTIENVLDYRSERWGIKGIIPNWIIQYIASCIFSKFSYQDVQPGNIIHLIEKDIPMLFITVEGDHSVPKSSTLNLIDIRKKLDHKNIHHFHMLQGKHGHLLSTSPEAAKYAAIIHAFFAHYNLPYKKSLALKGKPYLK